MAEDEEQVQDAAEPPTIEAYLDGLDLDHSRGWAWTPAAPEAVACVSLIDEDGAVVARTWADLHRGDLAEAGKREGLCGFELAIPADAPGELRLVVSASGARDLALAEGVMGRAAKAAADDATRLSSPSGVSGWLDGIGGDGVSGWCHGPEPFGPALELELVEGDHVLATTVADRWRNDVEDLRQGDGRCGFFIPLPEAVADGRRHRLSLRTAAGEALMRTPIAVVAEPRPAKVGTRPPEIVAPPIDTRPDVSVIVNFFNMKREAARTLLSLSRRFQEGVEDLSYEVICIDNGSDPPMTEAEVSAFGPQFRLLRPSVVEPSPCRALNEAAAQARGRWLALMIDGAHILSPGALREAARALSAEPDAVVALRQWFVGGDQRWLSAVGYSPAQEDVLFSRIDWPNDGYGLFDISSPMYESPNSWLDGLSESNCTFLSADLFRRIGGFDARFDTPGAGFANLDFFRRAAEAAGAVAALVGEASFHQFHGGVTTNVDDAQKDVRVRAYANHYTRLRGEGFVNIEPADIRLHGAIRVGSALTSRQRPFGAGRLGVTSRVRPRPESIQFDEEAQRYLQSAYVETGRHLETRWRGEPVGVSPTDLIDIQEAIWRARPQVVLTSGVSPGLVAYIATLLPSLDLADTRLARAEGAPGPLEREVEDAERVLVMLQPQADDALPVEALAAHARLVTLDSYLIVLGVALGQPFLGYSCAWTQRAVARFVKSHPAFVVDRTLNRHFVTTTPGGFLRRVLDPMPARRYDPALDDLTGL